MYLTTNNIPKGPQAKYESSFCALKVLQKKRFKREKKVRNENNSKYKNKNDSLGIFTGQDSKKKKRPLF